MADQRSSGSPAAALRLCAFVAGRPGREMPFCGAVRGPQEHHLGWIRVHWWLGGLEVRHSVGKADPVKLAIMSTRHAAAGARADKRLMTGVRQDRITLLTIRDRRSVHCLTRGAGAGARAAG